MNESFSASDINSCLCLASKRQNGLLNLSEYLNKCSSHVVEEHAVFWFKTLLQIIENHPVTLHAKLSHYCLYVLVGRVKCSSELNKLISTSYVEKITNTLLACSEPLTKNSLVCLLELINSFRAACGQYKQRIETFVLNNLDSDSAEVTNWAAKCYAKLPGLHRSSNNNDIWSTYFNNTLANANQLLSLILEDFQNHDSEGGVTELQRPLFKQNLAKDQGTLDAYYQKLQRRFRACCKCLSYLLTHSDDQLAKIRTADVNALLKRIFYFDYKTMVNNQFYAVRNGFKQFTLALSCVYASAFEFSQSYFSLVNTSLITSSDFINKTFLFYNSIGYEENLIEILPVFYETIVKWIESVGVNSGFYKAAGASILANLLANVKPKNSLISIDIKNDDKNKKKLVEQLTNNKQNKGSKGVKVRNSSSFNDHQVAIASLKCLQAIVKNFNHQFNYSDFNKIQRTIINQIINVQQDYSKKELYSDEECRFYLYQNLFQLCLSKNLKISPPLAMSTSLFNGAKNDTSSDIRSFAQQSLLSLCAFINPVLPISYVQYEEGNATSHERAALVNGMFDDSVYNGSLRFNESVPAGAVITNGAEKASDETVVIESKITNGSKRSSSEEEDEESEELQDNRKKAKMQINESYKEKLAFKKKVSNGAEDDNMLEIEDEEEEGEEYTMDFQDDDEEEEIDDEDEEDEDDFDDDDELKDEEEEEEENDEDEIVLDNEDEVEEEVEKPKVQFVNGNGVKLDAVNKDENVSVTANGAAVATADEQTDASSDENILKANASAKLAELQATALDEQKTAEEEVEDPELKAMLDTFNADAKPT